MLDEWIKLSPANEKYFNDMQFIFETSSWVKKSPEVNTAQAWENVLGKLDAPGAKVVPMPKPAPVKNRRFILRIAASLIVLLGITSLVYYINFKDQPGQSMAAIEAGTEPVTRILPDGSTATIQANSSLTPLHEGRREYALRGEGTFDVIHDDKDPFIIHHDGLKIKDIGTRFSVSAQPGRDTVRVTVLSGIVQLYTASQPGIRLVEGQTGIYCQSQGTFAYIAPATDSSEANQHAIAFEDRSLQDVVTELNKIYNTNIVFGNSSIRNCHITVKFNRMKLTEVLDIISETLGIWYKKENGKIILGGNGCEAHN